MLFGKLKSGPVRARTWASHLEVVVLGGLCYLRRQTQSSKMKWCGKLPNISSVIVRPFGEGCCNAMEQNCKALLCPPVAITNAGGSEIWIYYNWWLMGVMGEGRVPAFYPKPLRPSKVDNGCPTTADTWWKIIKRRHTSNRFVSPFVYSTAVTMGPNQQQAGPGLTRGTLCQFCFLSNNYFFGSVSPR